MSPEDLKLMKQYEELLQEEQRLEAQTKLMKTRARRKRGTRKQAVKRGVEAKKEVAEKVTPDMEAFLQGVPHGAGLALTDEIIEYFSPEEAEKYRADLKKAREDAPVSTFAGEMVGSMGLGALGTAARAIPKAGKYIGSVAETIAGSRGGNLVPSAIEAAGEEEGDLKERGMAAAKGAAFGMVGDVLGRTVGKVTDEPAVLRAQSIGATAKDFEGGVFRNVEEAMTNLKDIGFFGVSSRKFDPKTMKMSEAPVKGIALSKKTLPRSVEVRSKAVIEDVSREADKLLGKNAKIKVSIEDILDHPEFQQAFAKFEASFPSMMVTPEKAYEHSFKIQDIVEEALKMKADADGMVSVKDLIDVKREFKQDDLFDRLKIQDTPLGRSKMLLSGVSVPIGITNTINDLLPTQDAIKHKRLNDILHDVYQAGSVAAKTVTREKGSQLIEGMPNVSLGQGGVYTYLPNALAGLIPIEKRANWAEFFDAIPGSSSVLSPIIQEGYSQAVKQGAGEIGPRREPQSIRSPQSLSMSEELETMDIPRNSQDIMSNPDAIIAIVAQRRPEVAPLFEQLLKHNPEKLEAAMPALIAQFPDLFEPDEFDSYDGKVLSPAGMGNFTDDIYRKIKGGEMSSVEGLELINRMHNNKRVK